MGKVDVSAASALISSRFQLFLTESFSELGQYQLQQHTDTAAGECLNIFKATLSFIKFFSRSSAGSSMQDRSVCVPPRLVDLCNLLAV